MWFENSSSPMGEIYKNKSKHNYPEARGATLLSLRSSQMSAMSFPRRCRCLWMSDVVARGRGSAGGDSLITYLLPGGSFPYPAVFP